MDRDLHPDSSPSDILAPVARGTALRVSLYGTGMIAFAAVIGTAAYFWGEQAPWWLATIRLLMVFVGSIAVGIGISLRPELWEMWALGAAASLVGIFGIPSHWDSFRFLFGVLLAVALIRTALVFLPRSWRIGLVSTAIVVHFFGIFLATTSPPTNSFPPPWFVEQIYHRVYNQYLQFSYLRNAYHFYSPEPGPASLLCFLFKTEIPGEKQVTADGQTRPKYEIKWLVMPTRPVDIRDPMGLSYYRRLSLTEQVAKITPDWNSVTFEKTEVMDRRNRRSLLGSDPSIPFHPSDPAIAQYRLPSPEVTRFLLPSYARHLILDNTPDAAAAGRTTVKVYRIEHRTLNVNEFIGVTNPGGKAGDPYHPVTYRPYFLGEFDALGRLVDPQADMLYWLLPILPRAAGSAAPGDRTKDFIDYMSIHAGADAPSFEWSQLR